MLSEITQINQQGCQVLIQGVYVVYCCTYSLA